MRSQTQTRAYQQLAILNSKIDLAAAPMNSQYTKSVCLPVLDIAFGVHKRRDQGCMTFNDQVFEDIKTRISLKRVIMSLRMTDDG